MARVASIFKLHVKEGREREFVERVNAYAEIVRRTEPGALYYEYYRLRKPRWYAVVECFADQAAEAACSWASVEGYADKGGEGGP